MLGSIKDAKNMGDDVVLATMVCAAASEFTPSSMAELREHPEFSETVCDCCGCSVVYQSGNVPRIVKSHATAYPNSRCLIVPLCMGCSIEVQKFAAAKGIKQGAVLGNKCGSSDFREFEKQMADNMGLDYIDPVDDN